MQLKTILKWLDFKPEKHSKQGSFYSCLAANITKYALFCVQTVMPFFVGDHVTYNATKVLGNKHAKQRYGRLFKDFKRTPWGCAEN